MANCKKYVCLVKNNIDSIQFCDEFELDIYGHDEKLESENLRIFNV